MTHDRAPGARSPFGTPRGAIGALVAAAVSGIVVCRAASSATLRRRLPAASRDRTAVGEIVGDCEQVAAEAVELRERGGDPARRRARCRALQTELVELEWRTTCAANATGDRRARRQLDQLAAAILSLRAALEVDARARVEPMAGRVLESAVDDVVTVRSEDVIIVARALGAAVS